MHESAATNAPFSNRSSLAGDLRASVRALYERFPYPHYPLLAKPRWQEGWLTGSRFNAFLAGGLSGSVSGTENKRILIAGCGEILPAVICANEPRSVRIDAVDLSANSLRRALFRCASEVTRLRLRRADASEWLERHENVYDHIDCYGVLHHLADPLASLNRLARALKPGGTARVMVYNTPARTWIHEWQHIFRLLQIKTESKHDIALAMRILGRAGQISEGLGELLARMGPSLLNNETRFADTFLHPREARISPAAWTNGIVSSGLRLSGIFDRYDECDDLANPLWGIDPSIIIQRVNNGLLENNLEFFLQRSGGAPFERQTLTERHHLPLSFFLPAPRTWWATSETNALPYSVRQMIWVYHRRHIAGKSGTLPDAFIKRLGDQALRRLARLGALLPGQLTEDQRATAKQPLAALIVRNDSEKGCSDTIDANTVVSLIEERCRTGGHSSRRQSLIMRRLARALRPARPSSDQEA